MLDPRVDRMASVLVDYSTHIQRGDRVLIEAEPVAEPLVRALFRRILLAGGHPHLQISLGGQTTYSGLDTTFLEWANDEQLSFMPTFMHLAYKEFESRIRVHSIGNTKALSNVDHARTARRSKAVESLLQLQMERGARGEFKWVTTLFPTQAYAQDSDMSLSEFEDFVFAACHVREQDGDPIGFWRGVQAEQQRIVDLLAGHDRVEVRGPNVDLQLSVKGRTFLNACGEHNMPDGEVFTGPVETSVNGWVKFPFPGIYHGNEVQGVELRFVDGRVTEAKAERNPEFLLMTLDTDPGARYLGEFAIGNNAGVNRITRDILFDEKFGGTIHMALGAGYPDTGSVNHSAVHWDLICDMRRDAEIRVDGMLLYKDGKFRV